MPHITALAKQLRDWDGLIGNCRLNPAQLAGIEPLVEVLVGFLAVARDLKLDQENLNGQRKDRTQRLDQAVHDGQEAARHVRNFIKIRLGSHSEQLTQYGITPIRTRHRRNRLPEQPPPEPQPEIEVKPLEGDKREAPPATTMDANPQ
jgi:hypothetical protein